MTEKIDMKALIKSLKENDGLAQQHFIITNTTEQRRYADFQYYCSICEQQIKNEDQVVQHLSCFTHKIFIWRREDRAYLQNKWKKAPPKKKRNLAIFVQNIHFEILAKMNKFYEKHTTATVSRMMSKCRIVKGYKIEYELFGSFSANLLTTDNPIIDCYFDVTHPDGTTMLSNSQKFNILKQLPQFTDFGNFSGPFYGKIANCIDFKAKFFFTVDPKAKNAVLSSRLVSLYTYGCSRLYHLCHLLREWARLVGLLKPSKEFRVSGSVFDYMTIYFLQRFYNLPVINENNIGCPLKEFLEKTFDQQQKILDPIFKQFDSKFCLPEIEVLFMHWILFYATSFSYDTCIQITSNDEVSKDKAGVKTICILDPIDPEVNVFVMRSEQFIHFENMLIYGATDFLHPNDKLEPEEVIILVSISANSNRRFSCSYAIFDRPDEEKLKTKPLLQLKLDGLAVWIPESAVRPTIFCYFCNSKGHVVQECRLLSLKVLFKKELPSDICDHLSVIIKAHYEANKITETEHKNAKICIKKLQDLITTKIARSLDIHQFGSFKSGFGLRNSDLDLCIKDGDKMIDEPQKLLEEIATVMQEAKIEVKSIFAARVPILKFDIVSNGKTYNGDISCLNDLALENTALLAQYAAFDSRVAPLVLIVKKWANATEINSAPDHTFSSYALSVMVIHFLQRIEPPILPYLQDAKAFGLEVKLHGIHEIHFAQPSTDYQRKFCKNKMSLGELFFKFFEYFGSFNWEDEVVQIRKQGTLFKIDKDYSTRAPLLIEDPFDLNHNLAGSVRFSNSFVIFKCFNIMQMEFRKNKSVFLDKGFNFDSNPYQDLLTHLNCRDVITCHRCGEGGHIKKNCKKPIKSIAKEQQ